jgi:DNA-binding SARP family transcriptional activator/tetratricopeptide (TPR) repeat protein
MTGRRLRFGVLGPLAVWADGEAPHVGGRKQRILLAALLVGHGRPVSTDRLVEAMWPGGPPRSAVANLQTYVSGLRACLPAAAEGPRIRRHADGYSIVVAPGELDLTDFQDLVERAGAATDGEATALLEEAVALWRGDPLEDLEDCPLWRAETAGLVEQRLAAVEDLCGLRLAVGRPAPNITDLRRLLARHPLREGLWQQLILALRAEDRRAEALEAYAEVRERFADELGTEPGLRLRRLHETILRDDEPHPGPDSRSGLFPVCQLPADTPDFTGREAQALELAAVVRARSGTGPPPIAVVAGAPGVGKSAFAVHVCHGLRGEFPDGQLYLDLHGVGGRPRESAEVLADVLRTLGLGGAAIPRSLNERAALYRSMFADRRMLVLIDGAVDTVQVRPLLPATPGSAAVITSGRRLTGLPGAHHLDLEEFRPDEAVRLLARIAGPDRIDGDPEHAAAIVRACGGLPLAIRIAGAKLCGRRGWSPRDLAERLADESRRLTELQVGDLGVRATFDLSAKLLRPPAARVFRLLGLLGTPDLPGWVAGVLLDRPDGDDVLDELVDASLLQVVRPDLTGPPRYRLHNLLRRYACETAAAEPDLEREAALGRVLDTWLAVAEAAAARLPASLLMPKPEGTPRLHLEADVVERLIDDPIGWFETERRALSGAVALAAEHGLAGAAWRLAVTLVPYFDQRSLYEDWWRTHRQALDAVLDAGDVRGEAALQRAVGQVYVYWDRYDEAITALERSRELYDRLGDPRGVALADVGMGTVHRVLGHDERALDRYEDALAVLVTTDDRQIEAQVRGSVAAVLMAADRADEARTWLEAALTCSREAGDAHREARVLSQFAELSRRQGDPDGARDRLEGALAVFDALKDDRCAAYALLELARCHLSRGDRVSAGSTLDRALDIFRRIGNRRGQAAGLQVLGDLRAADGDQPAAETHLRHAARLWRELDAPVQRARPPVVG